VLQLPTTRPTPCPALSLRHQAGLNPTSPRVGTAPRYTHEDGLLAARCAARQSLTIERDPGCPVRASTSERMSRIRIGSTVGQDLQKPCRANPLRRPFDREQLANEARVWLPSGSSYGSWLV
jgi:hypothetical protein